MVHLPYVYQRSTAAISGSAIDLRPEQRRDLRQVHYAENSLELRTLMNS
jgi:hypothetical protein